MENLETKIIRLLKENARFSMEELAVMAGSDVETVKAVVNGLEQNGTILKYTAVLNPDVVDDDSVSALIEVKVTPQARRGFDATAEELAQFEEVKAVYLMSGSFDLAILLEGKTLQQISTFVSEKLSLFECVTATATHFIMRRYKEDGVTVDSIKSKKRLPISQ